MPSLSIKFKTGRVFINSIIQNIILNTSFWLNISAPPTPQFLCGRLITEVVVFEVGPLEEQVDHENEATSWVGFSILAKGDTRD